MLKQDIMFGKISSEIQNEVLSDCYFGIARHYEFTKKFLPMLLNIFISIYYYPKWLMTKKKVYMIYAYIFGKPSNNY